MRRPQQKRLCGATDFPQSSGKPKLLKPNCSTHHGWRALFCTMSQCNAVCAAASNCLCFARASLRVYGYALSRVLTRHLRPRTSRDELAIGLTTPSNANKSDFPRVAQTFTAFPPYQAIPLSLTRFSLCATPGVPGMGLTQPQMPRLWQQLE